VRKKLKVKNAHRLSAEKIVFGGSSERVIIATWENEKARAAPPPRL